MKTTPWYPGTVKPVRVGLYQRDYGREGNYFCRWDGKVWYCGHYHTQIAAVDGDRSFFQDIPWRGLTKEAK